MGMVEQATIVVKRGVRFDTGAVNELDRLVNGTAPRPNRLGEVFADGNCWVARIDGEIVGFMAFTPALLHRWTIEMLAVHPDHRRKGIGTALVRQCEIACSKPQFFTAVGESNEAMHGLLTKLGHAVSGQIADLTAGENSVIYVMQIG